MKKLATLIFFILFIIQSANSQDYEGLRFGLKLPYSFNFGYYQRIADRWGAYGGLQAVTFPFSSAPVGFLQMFSKNDKVAEILREPYSIGAGFDVGAHYYFGADNRRYYIAANLQWINLLKRDITDDVIESAFGVEFDDYPIGPILEENSMKPLTLNTHYLNFGVAFGYKFLLPYQPNWDIMLEFEVQKTLASHHFLFSDYRYITPAAEITSLELKKLMQKSGWFPSLNIIFIYKYDN
jgi:hypothetical protein